MRKVGRVKRILVATTLAAGCCFAYDGAWPDPDSGLSWAYNNDGGSDGLILTGLSGTCPEALVIPSDIPIVRMVGNEVVTSAYFVEALQGICRNKTNISTTGSVISNSSVSGRKVWPIRHTGSENATSSVPMPERM